MAHTSYKVAVRGGHAALARRQDTHIAAQAGAAGRRADHSARLDKDFQKPFLHGVHVDLLGAGNHDAAQALLHLSALQDFRGRPQIIHPSVRAGTDHHLIDLHVARNLVKGPGILRKVRKGHGGLQRA